MKYDWILFDADETLFHFDAFKGMQLMFSRKGIEFTQEDYSHYQTVNEPLWVDYQNGTITAHELKHTRFKAWHIIIIKRTKIIGLKNKTLPNVPVAKGLAGLSV